MYEYLSEAVVLENMPRGELDARVSLFTKKYGKLVGKAKSTRKITSKLVGHLQPGNLIQVRIVERGGLQIVDALKKTALPLAPDTLRLLNLVLAETEPDEEIWNAITQNFSWTEILAILGWDPRGAECRICGAEPHGFRVRDQEFFCRSCAGKIRREEVIYI